MYYYVYENAYHYDYTHFQEIRKREGENYRDEKARKMIQELKEQRIRENKPSSREPVLVSRSMNHLPKPGIN